MPLSQNALSGNPPRRAPAAALLSDQAWREIARSLRLSVREVQIVRSLFDDATEEAAAASLGISSHTVHTHLERLRHKLGVATRTQIVLRIVTEFLALTTGERGALPPLCRHRAAGRCPLKE